MPSKQHTIFISYSHKDGEAFAKELAEKLSTDQRGAGISFWKDYNEMHYGQWSKQIEKAIDAVEFLVMVITPKALASPNCKDEWMYARKNGVCILPVNGLPNDLDFYDTFPKWLQKQHIYNLEKQWDRFINDLNTQPQAAPVPFMAPRLTTIPHYVARQEELSQLKSLILNGNGGITVGITTALQGSGGFGKTTLAIALCNDDDIINYFDDGILWVTLGQQSGTARDALHKLYRGLSRETPSFIDVEEAQQKLGEKIQKRNCLVVIDDVWKALDLKQVIDPLGNCTILLTTRFAHILLMDQLKLVKVDEMKTAESVALLTGKFKDKVKDRKAFEKLAKQLGHWPLLLKLAGAQITKRIWEGETTEQAVAFVQKKYDRKGITGLDYEDAAQRDESVKKSLDASIELLTEDQKNKLLQLGIFPDQEFIPYEIIRLLWKVDDFETEELLEKLYQFALLELDFINKTCTIHDVLLHYYNEQLGKTKSLSLHENLVTSLGDFKAFKHKYAWKWYVWHFIMSGKIGSVINLLQNLDWIAAKLFATDITELLRDYEHFSLDDDTDLIYRALKLSAHILVEDRNQLPAQLIGRLGYFENKSVLQLTKKAKTWKEQTWLMPVKSSLTPPGNLLRILIGHTGVVSSLLIREGKIISGSNDNTIRIWDMETGRCLQTLEGHTDWISSLLVKDGKIISGSLDNTIRVWDTASGHCLQTIAGHIGEIFSLSFWDNNLISGSADSTIRIWNVESGTCLQTLRGHTSGISSLLVNENKIISGSEDTTIRIWETKSGQCVRTLEGHNNWISALSIQEGTLISGSADSTIRIWDMESGECLQTLKGHTGWIRLLLIQEGTIVSCSEDSTIRIWEISSGRCRQTLTGHRGGIYSLVVRDGKIISGSSDRTIRIWDLKSGKCLQILRGHMNSISSLLLCRDKIISGSSDRTIRIWETEFSTALQILRGHTDWIRLLLPEGDKIISGSDDTTINIWEAALGLCLQTLQGHSGWISSLLTMDDKIVSGSDDATIRIWEIKSGLCLQILRGHTEGIGSLLVHSGRIISGSYDRSISIWEASSGQWLLALQGHTGWISSLLIYEDKTLISGSYDNTIRIWEIETGQCLRILEGHKGAISSISLLKDGKIISGSFDATIRIWEISSGSCLQTLKGHTGIIRSLVIHEDRIISGSEDGTIRIWEMSSGLCLQTIQENAGAARSLLINGNKLISTFSSGSLIVYDVKMFTQIAKYYSDAEYTSQIVFEKNKIISGDKSGQLHILELVEI